MDFLDALKTSASGMTAQRQRMNVVASNLANINTTRTPEGGPYRRKDVVFAAVPASASFQEIMRGERPGELPEVKVVGIVSDPRAPQRKHDPQHPDADAEGYVALPNVNMMEEMVNMMSAARSYEAGVAVVKATKEMALKALEIGR
jgi:flagellar basal-body rod protein FlgC